MFDLSMEDKKKIDKDAVRKMIQHEEERLKIWSIPNYEKEHIKKDIKDLKKLLEE